MSVFTVYLIFSVLKTLTDANSAHSPRMVFKDRDTAMQRLSLPARHIPVQLFLDEDGGTVTSFGQKQLVSFNIQNPEQGPVERMLLWENCVSTRLPPKCDYNITLVHKREKNHMFVCATNGMETLCCDMDLSVQSPMCIPSEKLDSIKRSIRKFPIKEGEPSVLVESGESADFYIAYSGSNEYVGIYKFGKNRVGPAIHYKEQHYVALLPSRRKDDYLQDKVYAFYNEKNRDMDVYNKMWLPFVTQVCMADMGGPKQKLQFTWTSQMNARLICGDADRGQLFAEMVDVTTVHAEQWQDTKVYALFRNEWGMNAVCVYTIGDIDHIFTNSPFKGGQNARSRECVSDSRTEIPLETLGMVENTSEMQDGVRPLINSGPLIFNHHSYTHIYVDNSPNNKKHPVLFLTLNNGGVHKLISNGNQTFVIAEYLPFSYWPHILSVIIHPTSTKLYIYSRREVVSLDMANCDHYGDTCEECVLARDPYCGWNGTNCTPETRGTLQDVSYGSYNICQSKDHLSGAEYTYSTNGGASKNKDTIRLRLHSKYFLRCPVTSHHAQYTWHHPEGPKSCSSREQQCLLLIDSMAPKQVGMYKCVSDEMGYSRVLTQYEVELRSRAAGHSSRSLLLWALLTASLIRIVFW